MLGALTRFDFILLFAIFLFGLAGVVRVNKDSRIDDILIAFGLVAFALAFVIGP